MFTNKSILTKLVPVHTSFWLNMASTPSPPTLVSDVVTVITVPTSCRVKLPILQKMQGFTKIMKVMIED